MLVDEKLQVVVIDIALNYITKFNYHHVDINHFAHRTMQIRLKCRYYSVESIAILSVLVRNCNSLSKLSKLLQRVNISLKQSCKVYGFDFVYNNRIGKYLLWRDDLHLIDDDTSFLAIEFLNVLNSFHGYGNLSY